MSDSLPRFSSVAVVCAHPDDESFGLGAVLSAYGHAGSTTGVLCFTHGEASTLHTTGGDLAAIRAHELAAAADKLGVSQATLLDYADGSLDAQTLEQLSDHIQAFARQLNAGALLTFDHGGITGHPDHQQVTDAALHASVIVDIPVLAWTLPDAVANALNREFTATFIGRPDDDIDIHIDVDRSRQLAAIAEHRSQSTCNPELWRRLDLLGRHEHLRYLRR